MTKVSITNSPFRYVPELEKIVTDVFNELNSAIVKHPVWPEDDYVHMAAIVSEEAGEVVREANHIREGKPDLPALRAELIQTAAVCFRYLEILDTQLLEDQRKKRIANRQFPKAFNANNPANVVVTLFDGEWVPSKGPNNQYLFSVKEVELMNKFIKGNDYKGYLLRTQQMVNIIIYENRMDRIKLLTINSASITFSKLDKLEMLINLENHE